MKRLASIVILVLAFTLSSYGKSVYTHFGIEGGISATRQDISEKKLAGWHAGASMLVRFPGFFALQPTVEFERSRTRLSGQNGKTGEKGIDSINVPVAVQWGPDLGICRVFLEAVPFVGFNIGGTTRFGVGAGGGLSVWRIQLNARYNWTPDKKGLALTLAYFFN